MVCSVPGPDGLQTHFDQLRKYTQTQHLTHHWSLQQLGLCYWMLHKRGSEFSCYVYEWRHFAQIFWGDEREFTDLRNVEVLIYSFSGSVCVCVSGWFHGCHGDQQPHWSPWVHLLASAVVTTATGLNIRLRRGLFIIKDSCQSPFARLCMCVCMRAPRQCLMCTFCILQCCTHGD